MCTAVQNFYNESRAYVKGDSGTSECFDVKIRLRQGCEMSARLINMYVGGVVREVNTRMLGIGVEMIGQGRNVWKANKLF